MNFKNFFISIDLIKAAAFLFALAGFLLCSEPPRF